MALYISTPCSRMRNHMLEHMFENDRAQKNDTTSFPVDVKDEKDAYILTAYLPGVKSEDLNIDVIDDTVTITGKNKNEHTEEDKYLLQEWQFESFSRSLTLPDEMDAARAEASLKDGVLTVKLPKAEAALPKSIKVTIK